MCWTLVPVCVGIRAHCGLVCGNDSCLAQAGERWSHSRSRDAMRPTSHRIKTDGDLLICPLLQSLSSFKPARQQPLAYNTRCTSATVVHRLCIVGTTGGMLA